jgi:hypothetical protein
MPHTAKQLEMLNELDEPMRPFGEEVLDPNTSEKRLKEITHIGRLYHDMKQRKASVEVQDYSHLSDDELSELLLSPNVDGEIKDDVARFVTTRALRKGNLNISSSDESE